MNELREYIANLFNCGLNDKEIAVILGNQAVIDFGRIVTDEDLVSVIRSLMSEECLA